MEKNFKFEIGAKKQTPGSQVLAMLGFCLWMGLLGQGIFIQPSVALETRWDSARDMLRPQDETLEGDAPENENADSVARWGRSPRAKNKAEIKQARIVSPIEEASFAAEEGPARAPASAAVSAEGSRAPATLSAHRAVVAPSDADAPGLTAVRGAVKQNAFQETAVIASEQGFFPTTVFVTQGIPVRLFVTGASAKAQCFIMDAFGVRRQVKSQKIEEIRFVPEAPGTYNFNCPMNGARGTVVVREPSR